MEIKNKESNKLNSDKIDAVVNSAIMTGIGVSGTAFFGFSFLKSVRYEDYIGLIVVKGVLFLVFSALGIIEGNNLKINKQELEKTLKLNK